MPIEEPHDGKRRAKIRQRYRELLSPPTLTDREIDKMRQNLARLARTICEHVWGKKFY
jgi:hypothetical protein